MHCFFGGEGTGGRGVWVTDSTDSTVGSGLGRFLFCSVEGVPVEGVPVEAVDS